MLWQARALKATSRTAIQVLIVVTTLSSAVVAHAADDWLTPFTERLINTIFAEGLVSTMFEPQVRIVAASYTRKSKFAGNVRINESPERTALNVYIFNYSDRLPPFLRDNCNTFPLDQAILCDHTVFDSIPTLPQRLLVDPQFHVKPFSFLFYWILGHEIGHVLLRHDRPQFLSVAPANESSGEHARSKHSTMSSALQSTNMYEAEADEFAMSVLPKTDGLEWLLNATDLREAYVWGLNHLEDGELLSDGLHDDGESESTLTRKLTARVKVRPGEHPPMVVRLHSLTAQIRRTYPGFKGYQFLTEPNYVLTLAQPDEARPSSSTNLFYSGFYVGSHFPPELQLQRVLDRTLHMRMFDQKPQAALLRRYVCNREPPKTDVWLWQRDVVCEVGGEVDTSVNSDDRSRGNREEIDCDSVSEEDGLRCFGVLTALQVLCRQSGSTHRLCLSNPSADATFRKYRGRQWVQPDDYASMAGWLLVARYRFGRDLLPFDDNFDRWTIKLADDAIRNGDFEQAWYLLSEQAEYLENQTGALAWTRLFNHYGYRAKFSSVIGNDERAVSDLKKIVELMDAHLPLEDAAHGHMRLELASVLRSYGLSQIGSGEAPGYLWDKEAGRDERRADERTRAESVQYSEAAANAFLRAYEIARAKKTAPANGSNSVDELHLSYLVALNDTVYSYNLAWKMGARITVHEEAALKAGRIAMTALAQAESLREMADFDTRVEAPMLENVSFTHLYSRNGDTQLAIDYAKKAFEIRATRKDWDGALVPLQTLCFLFYRIGDREETGTCLRGYYKLFRKIHDRNVQIDSGYLVAGELIFFRHFIEWATQEVVR
jgi:hypothetical protein